MPIPSGTTTLGTPDQLATFLDVTFDADDTARADLMLTLARQVCEGVVTPLPDSALPIVLAVAARTYTNPEAQESQTVGATSSSWRAAGVLLLRSERLALKSLAGGGGAFTVDPTPSDAGTGVPVWAQNVTFPAGVPTVDEPVE